MFFSPKEPAESREFAAEHTDLIAKMKTIMAEQHAPSADFPMTAPDQ
jgi:hypothetical protein